MGFDYNTYFGPYVECVTREVPETVEFRACPNPACESYHCHIPFATTAFCPQCGTKIISVPRQEKREAVNPWDMAEKIKEALYCAMTGESPLGKRHVYIPNVKRKPPRDFSFYPKESDTFVWDLTDSNHLTEMNWLGDAFAKELKTMQATYGEENVMLRWGLVHVVS